MANHKILARCNNHQHNVAQRVTLRRLESASRKSDSYSPLLQYLGFLLVFMRWQVDRDSICFILKIFIVEVLLLHNGQVLSLYS